MTCAPPTESVCPCGEPEFPVEICNPPNLPAISYRAGDYLAFRHRLLQQLPDETALTSWRPGAEGDLAVQMVEWWAYIADILTFYTERAANEAYLGTAILPESVNHLVQLLGYRPRPALGSRATLAGLLTPKARLPVVLPAGLQIQSKPGPNLPPQIFELDAQTTMQAPDLVSANVVPGSAASSSSSASATNGGALVSSDGSSIWLAGTVTGIKPGDRFLLIAATALTKQTISTYAWINVNGTTATTDPLGNKITSVSLTSLAGNLTGSEQAADFVLLRSGQSGPLWGFPTTTAIVSATAINLAGITRSLTAGALFTLELAGSSLTVTPLIVTGYSEVLWYANCVGGTDPTVPPDPTKVPPVSIPHAVIGASGLPSISNASAANVTIRWAFTPVGDLAPVLTIGDLTFSGGNTALLPASGAASFPQTALPVLLEDANFNAVSAVATPSGNAITLGNLSAVPGSGLTSPMDVLFNLLPVSRGKTVPTEILGSGNPMIAGQDFTLKNAPVTYFMDPASVSGDNFSSTVNVSVDGLQWQEVQSFFGQSPNAQVFVLREDDSGKTHVMFGDGVSGARLTTGTNNITASYRFGAGAAAPLYETITVVQTPQPGLKGVRNPLPPTGGSDAQSAAKLSQLAPRSVLTFNRAVSLDDYAAIALTAAGVTQAVAGYSFDALAQRPMVTLWVAGDANAAAAAGAALAGIAMPNQEYTIVSATAVPITLSLTFLFDPRYDSTTLQTAISTALLDPDTGLFGVNRLGIGQAVYDSQIEAACLAVPGVTSVHDLSFNTNRFGFPIIVFRRRFLRPWKPPAPAGCSGHRHDPGAGNYFTLDSGSLFLSSSSS
jgi:hypothetical protein